MGARPTLAEYLSNHAVDGSKDEGGVPAPPKPTKRRGDNPRASQGTSKPKSTKPRKLTLKQQRFVAAYTDPSSPTFGNGTGSIKAAYPKANGGASAMAVETLRSPSVQSALQEALVEYRVTEQDRVNTLAHIAHGTDTEVTTIRNADGEVVQTQERPIPHSVRVKALDVVNKMTGTYAKADAVVDVQRDALKALIRSNRHLLEGGEGG